MVRLINIKKLESGVLSCNYYSEQNGAAIGYMQSGKPIPEKAMAAWY